MNKIKKLLVSAFFAGLFLVVSFILETKVVDAATLIFSPEKMPLLAFTDGSADVVLDTSGAQIVGIDVIINFNSESLEVDRVENLGVFTHKIGDLVNNKDGKLQFALSNDYGQYFQGRASVARIFFRQKNPRTGFSMNFVFDDKSTTDTNVVNQDASDALVSVGKLDFGDQSAVAQNLPVTLGESRGFEFQPSIVQDKLRSALPLASPEQVDQSADVLGEEDFVFPRSIIEDGVFQTDSSKSHWGNFLILITLILDGIVFLAFFITLLFVKVKKVKFKGRFVVLPANS